MNKLTIPVLETSRLILRAHAEADFMSCYSMWSSPEVVQYIGGKISTEQQTWSRLLNYLGHWALLGFGYWAVQNKSTGEFIGELGFADFKREITPSLKGIPEIGWVLAPKFQGQGYATEALNACLSWGELHLKALHTACIIHPQNAASLRIAEKLGFQKPQEILYLGSPVIIFSRPLRSQGQP